MVLVVGLVLERARLLVISLKRLSDDWSRSQFPSVGTNRDRPASKKVECSMS